jgi:hypothetical protein
MICCYSGSRGESHPASAAGLIIIHLLVSFTQMEVITCTRITHTPYSSSYSLILICAMVVYMCLHSLTG